MRKRNFDLNKLPTHVAIIMDGNGTWARKRGLPRKLWPSDGGQNFT